MTGVTGYAVARLPGKKLHRSLPAPLSGPDVTVNTPAPRPAAGTLAPDTSLSRLVRSLALTLQKRAIYPDGHPLLQGATGDVAARVADAARDRGVVSIGVTGTSLIIEGVSTDENQILARELAERLHMHQIAALHLHAGVGIGELEDLIGVLAAPVRSGVRALGSYEKRELARWPNIGVIPISFDHLVLDAEADSVEAQQMWMALARAALERMEAPVTAEELDRPFHLAGIIDAHRGDTAYENELASSLLQTLMGLNGARGIDNRTEQLRSRVSGLVDSLSPETLERILLMGDDSALRTRFVREATNCLAARAVVDIARAAASASHRPISDAMLRLLSKLARRADQQGAAAAAADITLRAQVHRMIDGWELEDPNPARHRSLLQDLSRTSREEVPDRGRDTVEPERVVHHACAVETAGPAVDQALARWLSREGAPVVLNRVMGFPEGPTREDIIERLVNGPILTEQLGLDRPDLHIVGYVVDRLRSRAVEPLLTALGEREEKDSIWLADLLQRTGDEGHHLMARTIRRQSTAAQRVVLGVLDRVDVLPSDEDLDALSRAEDWSIRRDSLRLLLKKPATRTSAIMRGLRDRDERIISMVLMQVLEGVPASIVEAIMERMDSGAFQGAEVRSRAVRAVAASGSESVVSWLRNLALTQHWLLRYTKLRKVSPETVTAIAALVEYWPDHPVSALPLLLARRSREVAYRHAARRREEA